MFNLSRLWKPHAFLKSLLSLGLVIVLVSSLFCTATDSALAARGGRIGGGSFRAPRPSFSTPRSRTYIPAPRGGFGGGIGFPFLLPFYGFGFGGGLFSLLILITVVSFLARTLRQVFSNDDDSGYAVSGPSKVAVAKLQIGLLAGAKSLQTDLERIAATSDTATNDGLAGVLQETSLALLRHPEYWAYGDSKTESLPLNLAEGKFNNLALQERSKFTQEAISNVQGKLQSASGSASEDAIAHATEAKLAATQQNEYIVVTLLVGTQGSLKLPSIHSVDDLRQAIRQMGAVPAQQLLAAEILWAPQGEGDVLTADDVIAQYPSLKVV